MAKVKNILELQKCHFECTGNVLAEVMRNENGDVDFRMSDGTKTYELTVDKSELVVLYCFLKDIAESN